MPASKNPGNRRGKPRAALAAVPDASVSSVEGLPTDPPASLGATGRAYWSKLIEVGESAYQATDRFVALVDYCKLRDLEADLEADVEAAGRLVPGSQGQEVLNPALRHLMDVRKEIRAAGKDLALNPRDRLALSILAEQSEDALDALIRRRGA